MSFYLDVGLLLTLHPTGVIFLIELSKKKTTISFGSQNRMNVHF